MTPTRPLLGVIGGVLGGWLAIMAPAVVTLALRLQQFDSSGLPTFYAATLAVGWLTMIVALIGSGYWGDAVRRRTGSRARLARIGVPLILVGGILLAVAPSPTSLLIAWFLVQIPSAMVITTALAESGDALPRTSRGITSGLIGAASILALLLGTVVVRLLADSLDWAFIVPALIGALIASPLMFVAPLREVDAAAPTESGSATTRLLPLFWVGFLIASFLLSWSTSTTNGFLVTFVQYALESPLGDIAATTTGAVILASFLAVVASVTAGVVSRGQRRSVGMWIAAAAACGIALAGLVIAPSITMLYLVAVVFGVSFGVANGVELSVILLIRTDHRHLGRDLGVFTATTSAPYVLVPALATVLLAGDTLSGVTTLFTLAFVGALAAALLLTLVALRRTRTT